MRVIANDENGLPIIYDDVKLVRYNNGGTISCFNSTYTTGIDIFIPNKIKINPENYKRFFDTLISTGSVDLRNHPKYIGRIQEYPVYIGTKDPISIRTDPYDFISVDANQGDPVSVKIYDMPNIKIDND